MLRSPTRPTCRRVISYLLAFAVAFCPSPRISGQQSHGIEQLQLADADLRAGRYQVAAQRYRNLLRVLDAKPDRLLLLPTLAGLSVALLRTSELEEAESVARRAVTECNATPAAMPRCRVYAANNLGSILVHRRQSVEGEALLREAAAQSEAIFGPDQAVTAEVLGNLGGSLEARGELDRAEPVLRRSLWIFERVSAGTPLLVANAHYKLGYLYLAQRRLSPAEDHLDEALRLWRAHAPPNHPGLVSVLGSLVQLRTAQRRYDDAESLLAEADAVLAPLPATWAPQERVTLLTSRAVLASQRHHTDSALSALGSAIQLQLRLLPANHPALLNSVGRYAAILRSEKRRGAVRRVEAWSRMLQHYPAGRRFVPKCPPGVTDCCRYYLDRPA